MAKKKLNKQVAAFAASAVIILGGGGFAAAKLYQGTLRPAQFKKEGRELMLKGDYEGAYRNFARAAGRLTTDIELLGWLHEMTMRRTSFEDGAYWRAGGQLDAMLATRPDDVPTIVRRLAFDLDLIDLGGIERFGPEQARRMKDLAERALAAEPTNPVAIRAGAMASALPIFKQDTSQTSADVEAIIADLRKRLEAHADNADVLWLYTIATLRHREVLTRENAIAANATDPRVREMFTDVNARVESLQRSIADEAKPAELRATGHARSARIDRELLERGMIESNERAMKIYERRNASLAAAAKLAPPTSDLFLPARAEQANTLERQEKLGDAEAVMRETVAAMPLSWQPRLILAEMLADQGRAGESLELTSADLKPSTELIGVAGLSFFHDRRQVPLRRAFYRLQNLSKVRAEDREKEIAAAQADYDLALADGKITESDPLALQIRGAMQELKMDRTGAAQTLTRALEALPPGQNDRLRLRLQQQLVTLNLALNQPGAASAMLEQMMKNRTLTPQTQVRAIIQLIDLSIRNGATEQARLLLSQAKNSTLLKGNPALVALDIKLMPDAAQRKAGLAQLPEETPPQRFFKIKFAGEVGDEETMRRLAEDALRAEPGALDVSMIWADFLRRNNKRDEAIAVFKAAQAVHPENKTLDLLIKDTQAVTSQDRQALMGEMITDPYKRALYEAEQMRGANDLAGYLKKLEEAEPLDVAKDGLATERLALYHMATGDGEKAGQAIERLAAMQRDPAQVRVLRVRNALASRRLGDAAAQADSLTADLPTFSPGWVMKGQVHHLNNQPSQAIDAFETALAQQPDNVEALTGLVEAADRGNRRDLLKRYIDEGLRVTRNADDFFVDASLRYELTFGDPNATIEPRLKRRDARPDDPKTWVALAQSYLASARAKETAGDVAAATDLRNRALEVFKQGGEKFPGAGAFTLEAARLVAQGGDVEGAVRMVELMDARGEISPDVQALRAQFYAQYGRTPAAMTLLQQQIEAGKASDGMRLQLATLQSSAADHDAALRSLSGMADSPGKREASISVLLAANRADEAQKVADEALARERSVPNLQLAAFVHAKRNRLPDALRLAEEALAVDPENAALRFIRARILLGEVPLRNNEIVADLQVVRKNNPGNVDARIVLAERLRALSRGPEALQELESLQRDFPTDTRAVTQLARMYANEVPPRYARIDQLLADAKTQGRQDPQLLSLESSVAQQRGDHPRAIAAARAAWQMAPQDIGLHRAMLSAMLRGGAMNEVIAEVDRAQKDNSSLYWTYLMRGAALHRLKREDEAASEFDRAIGLAQAMKESADPTMDVATTYAQEYGAEQASDWIKSKLPNEPATRVLQMRMLTNAGKTDRAIAVGEELVANLDALPKPARVQVLSSMGNAYLTATPPQADNARTIFARLNELEPDNMMTLNNLAYSMTLSGTGPSMQEAVQYARRAHELAQKNATPNAFILDTYGWALVQSGKLEEGLAILREAFEAGSLPETEYHIGEVYVLQGQKDAALQALKSALAKVNAAKQNGQPVDSALAAHIEDAMRRAQVVATP